jgi:hypothetical protein
MTLVGLDDRTANADGGIWGLTQSNSVTQWSVLKSEGWIQMKVIQVPMDEKLLQVVNRKARASRSTLIRAACQEYLHRLEEQELERRYVQGYGRKPEKPRGGR